MTDLAGEWVTDEQLDQVFAVMGLAERHTFRVLTKRSRRLHDYVWTMSIGNRNIGEAARRILKDRPPREQRVRSEAVVDRVVPGPLPNVVFGVSVENQAAADLRLPDLVATRAARRFVSYEPALGPVNFRQGIYQALTVNGEPARGTLRGTSLEGIHQVIVGGESGPKARPFDVEWAEFTRDQCRAAGVAFYLKQMGALPVGLSEETCTLCDMGLRGPKRLHGIDCRGRALRDLKGGDPSEWPEDLRIREPLPAVVTSPV